MIIEVGKAYMDDAGILVEITAKHSDDDEFVGVPLKDKSAFIDCLYRENGQRVHDYIGHLISPWEDSKTQIKSESKMDVKVGDRVLVECRVVQVVPHDAAAENCSIRVATLSGGIWIHRSEIKSVEPAPPGVGDTVETSLYGTMKVEWFGPADILFSRAEGPILVHYPLRDFVNMPGFRVIKRAEPK